MKDVRVILASGSPRRREILDRIGLSYEVILPEVSEEHEAMPPEQIVKELSGRKAEAVESLVIKRRESGDDPSGSPVLIIAADTLVAYGDEVLGKPADRGDAKRMIRLLAGNTHHVYTGVTLIYTEEGRRKRDTFCESAAVKVRPMTEEEICRYVSTGEPDDKAGAYAIQGIFGKYVEGYDGDFETIKGLPGEAVREHIERILQKEGGEK